ncbi:xanthine dehydrogenase/oxidase isoform X1 [Syngnathus typhle]|uniref:xanthine dehydrogenase/oxidase isoform X1 n=1 Tax=Syngnathus typhle TaxID=161592 RepID=UPI002A6AA1A0|nr:xanthine dehydrogenase/oxidase isoform X1 [Syngnathus typhle]XP_061157642.1 xanthine dehydrogenase/oxidase isoform X1 [Syngnathus typhle]XP_061157651.1 xanthine dehydrogenase/oxidase isoform X1 [Syngnathus typhle]
MRELDKNMRDCTTCARSSSDDLVFFVNGKKIVETNADPEMTLLTYLRRKLGLPGTKLGCAEGGCGACTVMLSKYQAHTQNLTHYAVNACLAPICSLHLVAVTTVEGIGSVARQLHPVQERIAKAHGSQCGFCTPGIVMSMYALLRNNPTPKMADVEEAFQGNLCRCTGYRPILEAYKTFTVEGGCCGGKGRDNGCCMKNSKAEENEADVDMASKLFNTADFAPLDPTQEVIFPPELMTLSKSEKTCSLQFRNDRAVWLQPATLDKFLNLKWKHPDARVVVGNTEVGIEVKFKNMLYPVILAPAFIPELHKVIYTDEGIVFGAACTLTQVGEVLKEAVKELPSYQTQVFLAVLEQLRWFAGQQIRNVAAVGGNIMTASPISDLNPVFMAASCKLTLMDKDGSRVVQMDDGFFVGYRRTVLRPQEILLSIEIPYSRKNQFFSAFKQSPRREDDISIVTTAMSVTFTPGTCVVEDVRLSYGGMAATTVLAKKTANKLLGRCWGEALLEEACSSLAEELTLDPSAPGGMVTYRRTLSLSLFYKFYLTVLQKLREQGLNVEEVRSDLLSATEIYHQETPSSVQIYQEVPQAQNQDDVLGHPLMHLSALKQATGEAVYCDDIPLFENEVYLALVTSSKAHARILSVDSSAAECSPGFICCVFARDIPGSNKSGLWHDESVLTDDLVTCVGHVIGAVVADTQVHAQRAAKAVKIQYEELQPIITIQEAIAAQSFYKTIRTLQKGDLEAGFKQADHILEGETHIGGQEHFYLETNVTVAVPRGEDDEMELFSSTQNPSETQSLVALALGIPSNRVVVRVKRMGGGFGGKESRTTILSTVVSVAAHKLRRPVRCMLDRDEDMLITGGRHPFYGKYKVGFLKSGKLLALDVSMYSNAGNSLDLSQAIMERALFHMENAYSIPNVRGRGFLCRTNLPSNTAFRGFGGPQGMMIAETWMNDVAQSLGRPADEVRQMNLYKEGDVTPYNQVLDQSTLDRCWDECMFRSRYQQQRAAVELYNKENRWTKRGLAIIPTKFGISFTAVFLNQAGALVHIYTDGSVLLTHGGTEMGQGLHTKMIQVASRVLGVPCSKIHISETSTQTVPNTSPTAASASSDLNGAAVRNACQLLNERLEPYKSKNPKGSWEEWVKAAYFDRVNLSANGFYKTPNIGYSFETNSGRAFNYFSYGVACSEVEVDCLTGAHKNLSTTIVMDVGVSLNPAIDIGQVEGAFMQGLGMFTLEELHYSPQGVLLTRGPGSYKIPAFGDIPTELTVSLLRDAPHDKAIFASKAVGEPPLFLASSVFFAIKDAISAARTESGITGPFRLDSPASAERIRNACNDRFTKLCPPAEPGTFQPWSVQV